MPTTIPLPEDLAPVASWSPNEEEAKRLRRIKARIQLMLEARQPHELAMERSLLLYSAKSRPDPRDPKKVVAVAPLAKIFVDAQTAEEVKAMQPYEFQAGKDEEDGWKTQLVKDVDAHIRQVVKMGPKKIKALRMKNICGVSILRVGRRKIMRTIRDPQPVEDDEEPKYKLREVPMYDDLFVDLVSPFNFAVDPNATTMDDAMDCVHFHSENWETFYEQYAKNKMFKNTDAVRPGYRNMVDVAEYFNKQRDEWVILASPAQHAPLTIWNKSQMPVVELYEGPLPDAHKELPFVSYHNSPKFVSSYIRDIVARATDGSETTEHEEVRADEGFWTEGVPETLMDLIDLRTGFGRSAYRAMKKAGEYIVATAPGYVIDESRPWRTGDQLVGGKDKVQVLNFGEVNVGGFEFIFGDLFEMMVMAAGIDPRNLSNDQKEITATEAAIRKETSMRMLEMNLEYNEENGEVRLGTLIYQLMQQWYTKAQLVRLFGDESEEELKTFDEVEEDPETGKPFAGKRYRMIKSSVKMREIRRKKPDGTYKYTLTKKGANTTFFLARPDYIRSSTVRVVVKSGRRAGEVRAISIQQDREAIQLALEQMPLAQSSAPGMKPVLSPEDLPNLKKLNEDYMRNLGKDESYLGVAQMADKDEQEKEQDAANEAYMANRRPLMPLPGELPPIQ